MRSRTAFLVAALVLAAAASPAAAVTPLAPGSTMLYFSTLQAPLGGVGSVELLVPQAPAKPEDSVRNVTAEGAAWYALPPAEREVRFAGPVNGSTSFQVAIDPGLGLPILLPVHIQATVTFDLRRVTSNGTEESLGTTSAGFAVQDTPPVSAPVNVSWSITPENASLLPGEALAINVTATTTSTVGTVQMLYESTTHPGSASLVLEAVSRGQLALAASTLNRDAAPGSSPAYTVTVRNLGDQPDTVRFNATGTPAEWQVRVNPGQLTVSPGATGTALVTVVVPSTAREGDRHTTSFTATSGQGAEPQTITLTTTVRPASTTCPNDQDCDGYTDTEERRYGSLVNDRSSTPDTVDDDGDGVSNKAEIDAGTDPDDPNDFPGSRGSFNSGGNSASPSVLAPLSEPLAQVLGLEQAAAEAAAILLILLFIVILALLALLLLGSYPVKVSLVEAKGVTEPGRPADYSVEVRSRVARTQAVDLEVAGLPGDWDARLTQPRLNLEGKATETVGLLIRPPDGWPAPSRREFQVRARSRLKPGAFAKAVAKLTINPRPAPAAEPPPEEAVEEPAYEAPPAPLEEPPGPAYAPPPAPAYAPPPLPATPAAAPFQVSLGDVVHDPPVPVRGGEVATRARLDNRGAQPERVRVVLVVNGKVRDEVTTDLAPGEGAEAEFHWVAYLARNEVKVVAERL